MNINYLFDFKQFNNIYICHTLLTRKHIPRLYPLNLGVFLMMFMQQVFCGKNWLYLALITLLFYRCASSRSSTGGLPIDEVAVDVTISGTKSKRKKTTKSTKSAIVKAENNPKVGSPPAGTKNTTKSSEKTSAHTSAAKVEKLLSAAQSYLGTPYRSGGVGRTGMDCSGFVMVSFREVGITLPRTSREQSEFGQVVHKHEIQPGDLIFFTTGKTGTVGHSALVVERNRQTIRFIHAANSGVRIDDLSSEYWNQRFLKARRVLQ